MRFEFPILNLKAKLIALMVGLLALTLGAVVVDDGLAGAGAAVWILRVGVIWIWVVGIKEFGIVDDNPAWKFP